MFSFALPNWGVRGTVVSVLVSEIVGGSKDGKLFCTSARSGEEKSRQFR